MRDWRTNPWNISDEEWLRACGPFYWRRGLEEVLIKVEDVLGGMSDRVNGLRRRHDPWERYLDHKNEVRRSAIRRWADAGYPEDEVPNV